MHAVLYMWAVLVGEPGGHREFEARMFDLTLDECMALVERSDLTSVCWTQP
jgi:hypothetical protein